MKGRCFLKVCVVVLNSVWFDPRVRKQIAEYKRQGIDVCCVGYKCKRYDEEKVSVLPCPVSLAELDLKYQGGQILPTRKIGREFNRNTVLRNAIISQKPDIIHANDLNTLVACCQAAKILNCRVIYDSHEICVENTNMKGLYKKYFAYCEKKYIKKIDKMICVSNSAADYFEKKYKIERPMVITNCSLKSEQVIESAKNEGFEVLNHGQYYAGRGYDIMVEAIPYLKNYPEIKIALRGFGVMEDELKSRAKELGDENVRFYPKVLVNELIPYASKAKVGVAITEGICLNFKLSVSNKLFEYASAGLPVIMSDIPEHRYLNQKYNFGIVIDENSPKAFAKAVIKLFTDEKLYNSYVEGAKKLTEEVNWEVEFEKLIDFEKMLIKNNVM